MAWWANFKPKLLTLVCNEVNYSMIVQKLIPFPLFIAVTDFTVTEQRSSVMKFSTPLDQVYHAIFIRNPAKAYNYKAYTSQLSDIAWCMIGVWIILTPPLLFVVARLIS